MTTDLPGQKFYRVRTAAVDTEARKPARHSFRAKDTRYTFVDSTFCYLPELTITFSHQHLCCITPRVIENMIKAHGSKDEIPGMRTAGMSQAFEVAERAGSYEEVQEAFANAAATAAPSTPS